ncbi:transcriptional regulator, CdaR family [Agrococcus baldri]|uniref:Transcriptional regulator, CdaR family n=1 Tax=Agrococcus baldri TaxID=153730 RepID=A0AA94KZT9_9MICO|nr:PucR family transcriptional regulator [Agrococcus baldri]SFS12152.1 transcriptional regulator, CdaR family [Agrococcus baldri]
MAARVPGPATTEALLDEVGLELTALVEGDERRRQPIAWVSSSDLADPTPFLAPEQVLLTTGRQLLTGDIDAARYVRSLVDQGVLALGFGTGVHADETPDALVQACTAAGLPLFEVPYTTPFLALIRWAAEVASARDRWAVAAQRALAAAASAPDGTAGVVRQLSRELGATATLLDALGGVRDSFPDAPSAQAVELARTALRGQRRTTRVSADERGWSVVHTLGSGARQLGALTVSADEPMDAAGQAIVGNATALLELALATSTTARDRVAELESAIIDLALRGHPRSAAMVLSQTGSALPRAPIVIAAASAPRLRHRLHELAGRQAGDVLWRIGDDGVLVVAEARRSDALQRALAGVDATAGLSAPQTWADASTAVAQARSALRRAELEGAALAVYDPAVDGLLGLLDHAEVRRAAQARLGALARDTTAAEQVALARLWFAHDCSWDAAARAAGMHRHSLRDRVRALGRELEVDLESFAGRAALWVMLSAAGP